VIHAGPSCPTSRGIIFFTCGFNGKSVNEVSGMSEALKNYDIESDDGDDTVVEAEVMEMSVCDGDGDYEVLKVVAITIKNGNELVAQNIGNAKDGGRNVVRYRIKEGRKKSAVMSFSKHDLYHKDVQFNAVTLFLEIIIQVWSNVKEDKHKVFFAGET
jgi:hypothetical protein